MNIFYKVPIPRMENMNMAFLIIRSCDVLLEDYKQLLPTEHRCLSLREYSKRNDMILNDIIELRHTKT